jgi:hypothetical protein
MLSSARLSRRRTGLIHARRRLPVTLGEQIRLAHVFLVAITEVRLCARGGLRRRTRGTREGQGEDEVALFLFVRGGQAEAAGEHRVHGQVEVLEAEDQEVRVADHVLEPPPQEQGEVPPHREPHHDGLAQLLRDHAPADQRFLEAGLDVEEVGQLGHLPR